MDFATLPMWAIVATFLAAAAVILVVGTLLARVADRLADRTGLGEAMVGAVLLGGSTSLPGITTSVTAAWWGQPEIAMSNAVGGIAAQSAFLAVADFFSRRANLEHAAASVPNILHGTALVALLGLVLLAGYTPEITFLSIHPVTPLLLLVYLGGLHLARGSRDAPQWMARQTALTREDVPEPPKKEETLAGLWLKFATAAAVTAGAGWFVARTGIAIADRTEISGSVVGAVFTAISTSTPELITSIAAVRAGALTLAVANVLGGNAFDVLFAAAADVAYREGSIYHAIGNEERLLTSVSIVMAALLIAGLVYRERHGVATSASKACSCSSCTSPPSPPWRSADDACLAY
ncbi:MAG: hypothetical protein WD294_06535 [Phycisphaeraceae bacterium]